MKVPASPIVHSCGKKGRFPWAKKETLRSRFYELIGHKAVLKYRGSSALGYAGRQCEFAIRGVFWINACDLTLGQRVFDHLRFIAVFVKQSLRKIEFDACAAGSSGCSSQRKQEVSSLTAIQQSMSNVARRLGLAAPATTEKGGWLIVWALPSLCQSVDEIY